MARLEHVTIDSNDYDGVLPCCLSCSKQLEEHEEAIRVEFYRTYCLECKAEAEDDAREVAEEEGY